MAANVSEFLTNLETYQYQPAMIQKDMLDMLTQVLNGQIDIVDPTNPFVFNMEAAAVMTAGFMSKDQTRTRKLYPSVAQTTEDLYLHMSDWDYINMFAAPANATVGFLFDYNEILDNLVLDATTGISSIVIPRNTFITVAGTVFSLQYPVQIQQLEHGGLNIVYDASEVSPLQTLSTNVIPWETRAGNQGTTGLYFELQMLQMKVTSRNQPITNATAWVMTFQTTDEYYFTRVWSQNEDLTWTEITATYTAEVYDPTTPTAVIQVNGTIVTVTIPQIYTQSGQLDTVIRCDFYETKGAAANALDLGAYPQNAFVATWYAIDDNDITAAVVPLNTLKTVGVLGTGPALDGADGLSFEDLRAAVINNTTGPIVEPITMAQVQGKITRNGYTVVENIDNITNRTFLATKPMPDPVPTTSISSGDGTTTSSSSSSLITAANASIETINTTMTALSGLPTVVNNGLSMTITPQTIYKNVNGTVQIAPSAEVAALLALDPTQRALAVNAAEYYYTPFHYVLDSTGIEFAVRPYYLDGPSVVTTVFDATNATTQLQVSIDAAYDLVRTDTGFQLIIRTDSNAAYQALPDNQVFVQLAYVPVGETAYAYLNGVLQGLDPTTGERIFAFDLSSTMNVDSNDDIELTQFKMFTDDARVVKAALTTQFLLLYSTTAVMDTTYRVSTIDSLLGNFLLPANIKAITQEEIRLEFGQALESLWARSRSVTGSIPYQTYATDIPLLYTQDIYEQYGNGQYIKVDPDTGQLVMNKLHAIGDPVLDGSGNPVYSHKTGDVILDPETGLPLPGGTADITRSMDLMLIEGSYYFANDAAATAYNAQLITALLAWLTVDIPALEASTLEKTNIYFYPQSSMGDILVINQDGLKVSLAAGQQLQVTLYTPPQVYTNDDLRQNLQTATITALAAGLANPTVATSDLIEDLKAVYSSSVVDVELSGLGGTADISVFTVVSASDRVGLRKILIANADNSLSVSEAVTVIFINYDPTSAGADAAN